MKIKKVIFITAISSLIITPVFANTQYITFQNKTGNFYCDFSPASLLAKASDAKADIDTQDIKVEGFCQGKYVASPGHVRGMPVSTLVDHYFSIQKEDGKNNGTVIININSDKVTCHDGTGDKTKPYQSGGGFC